MPHPSVEEVRDFIVKAVGAAAQGNAANDLHLLNTGVIDSVEFVNLIAAIEDRFALEVDLGASDPDEFLTVGGLARCVVASAEPAPS
jgi:acyl carrier protein